MLTIRMWLGAVAMVVAAVLSGCQPTVAPPPARSAADDSSLAVSAPASMIRTEIGFRTPKQLAQHFQKHGGEFARFTKADYLRAAQTLRDAPVGGSILEIARGDGTVARFDRNQSAFVAFDADGTIRTFFKPNDGEAYFRRQAQRRHQ